MEEVLSEAVVLEGLQAGVAPIGVGGVLAGVPGVGHFVVGFDGVWAKGVGDARPQAWGAVVWGLAEVWERGLGDEGAFEVEGEEL